MLHPEPQVLTVSIYYVQIMKRLYFKTREMRQLPSVRLLVQGIGKKLGKKRTMRGHMNEPESWRIRLIYIYIVKEIGNCDKERKGKQPLVAEILQFLLSANFLYQLFLPPFSLFLECRKQAYLPQKAKVVLKYLTWRHNLYLIFFNLNYMPSRQQILKPLKTET